MLERLPSTDQLDRKLRGRGMDADDDAHITAADVAYLLHRHARLICIAILAGLAIASLIVLTTAPTFTARAQVLIDVQTPQTLPQRQGEITVAIDTTQVESQLAIMRSDNLAGTVVQQLGLAHDPEFVSQSPSLFQRLSGILRRSSGPLTPEDAQRVAVLALQERLEVRRQGLSFAIDIYVRSLVPEKAAKIANVVAEVYVADQLNTRAKAAQQGSEWLEERIDQLRRHMNSAALRVQEFKARRDYRIVGKGDRPAGQAQAGEPGHITEPATLEELESTAATYRRMYESFLQAYTDSVQRQSYPISNARVITPASPPFSKSHPKTVLMLTVGGLLGALFGLATALVRQNLDQSVRSAQQIRNKIGIDCLVELPLISRPAPLARGGLTTARSHSDRGQGHGPLHEAALARLRETLSKVKLRLETRLTGARQEQEHERAHWHEVNDAPFSPFSEALGHLKLRLTMGRRTTPIKTLGITSALPSEGKSTIASNLAELYSLHGSRAVIVDTDVRKSVISRALAPDAGIGLIDVLAGNADLASCLVPDKLSTLTVLPVGDAAGAANAPELFGSERMQKVIEELAGEFEIVVFDMPPLELVKDGLALSPLLDGILVIAEWGETPLPLLADTVDALRQANAHILGAVFSKVHGPLARNYRQQGRPYLVELKGASAGKRYSRLA